MNNRTFFITAISFLIYFQFCQGQTATDSEDEIPGVNYITFNLVTPIDAFGPRFRAGYIHSINERWMVGLAAGYGSADLKLLGSDNRIFDAYELWEIRPEVYYFPNPEDKWKTYASAELFYINHTDQLEDDVYQPDKDSDAAIRYDRVDYKRQKYGLNIKSGVFLKFWGAMKLNAYCGIGVRIRDNDFNNPINPVAEPDFFDEWGFGEAYLRRGGTFVGVNFSMGINLAYQLD